MKTRRMILCALFAALTAVCAQVTVPMGVVPMNLALLPVLVCGALLPWRYAAGAMLLYLLMGLAGLPVFAGMSGGPGRLFGLSGGYLFGYVLCAAVVAWLLEKRASPWLAMGAGVIACYGMGTLWLMLVGHMGARAAVSIGVLPFVLGDAAKVFVANLLARRLKNALRP